MNNSLVSTIKDIQPLITLPHCNVLDVTLRDGGFGLNFHWPPEFISSLSRAIYLCNIEYLEIGYIGGIPKLHGVDIPGIGSNIPCELVENIKLQLPDLKIFGMLHPSSPKQDLNLKSYSKVGLYGVRIVYHESWKKKVFPLFKEARELGLVVSINFALPTQYSLEQLLENANILLQLQPNLFYLADTCSALFPSYTFKLIQALRQLASPESEIGFHGHDFISLGLANSLAALEGGATWIDSSVGGIGRGAGNVKTEHLVAIKCLDLNKVSPISTKELVKTLNTLMSMGLHSNSDFLSAFVAVANLTPPDEDKLRKQAEQSCSSPNEYASMLFDTASHISYDRGMICRQ